jgi:rubrerythrin
MKISTSEDKIIISDFNDIEALQIALSLEKKGGDFYRRSSKLTQNKEISAMLGKLAKEEDKHRSLFTSLLKNISGGTDPTSSEEGLFDYIESGVFGNILEVDRAIKSIKNELDALELGEEAEEKTILFYEAIRENTENEQGQKMLGKILKEEAKHLETLERYKKLLKSP